MIQLNVSVKEVHTEYVAGINQKKAAVAQQLGSNRCPKCGGELLKRKGKFGDFKGCSNYPNVGLWLTVREGSSDTNLYEYEFLFEGFSEV